MKNPYSNVVGLVIYLMVSTRMDLWNVICAKSIYKQSKWEHQNAMTWLIRNIKCTTKVGLENEKAKGDVWLDCFVDSEYHGDRDKRRLTTSYVFCLSGCCVSRKYDSDVIKHIGKVYSCF